MPAANTTFYNPRLGPKEETPEEQLERLAFLSSLSDALKKQDTRFKPCNSRSQARKAARKPHD